MIPLDRLQQIIPADQALANKALSVALQQIAGISNTNLPTLSETISVLETNRDLPLINALTEAVPASIANYYINTLGQGNGANNNVLIMDVLGTAAGWISTDALANTVVTFNTMDLSYLTEIYDTMLDVVNGVYTGPDTVDPMLFVTTIPSGLPAAGTYGPDTTANATIDSAMSSGLIPVAQTEIGNIIAAYPTQISSLNTDWTAMAEQMANELVLQADANIVFADLTANARTSVYGFIYNLPSYGQDIVVGGMAQYIEAIADIITFTGQAIVATLRQGRNQQVLLSAGIISNFNIPADPNPPPPDAVLIPSEYTAQEAANLVIK
jgi:hypothetical protein